MTLRSNRNNSIPVTFSFGKLQLGGAGKVGPGFCPSKLPGLVKLTKSYGKSPLFMGKSTISMVIVNSYVSHYQRVAVLAIGQ